MESISVSEKGPSIGPETITGGAKNATVASVDGLVKSLEAKSVAWSNGSLAGS
jgi:hypothetical protein